MSKRSKWFTMRITEEERQLFQQAAVKTALQLNAWARSILTQAARKTLKQP